MDFTGWAPWVAIVISLAAFFRPNISHWLRAYFNKVQFHTSARVEVGFSGFGPTIGLLGALRASPNDQFVEQIFLSLRRESDGATHKFVWAVNRGVSMTPNNSNAQLMTGMAIKAYQALSLNIQFHDRDTRAKLDAPAQQYIETWNTFLSGNAIDPSKPYQQEIDRIYAAFASSNQIAATNFFKEAVHEFYWQKGKYSADICIRTVDPEKSFKSTIRFCLTQSDVDLLRNNLSILVRLACGASGNLNFAFAEYE